MAQPACRSILGINFLGWILVKTYRPRQQSSPNIDHPGIDRKSLLSLLLKVGMDRQSLLAYCSKWPACTKHITIPLLTVFRSHTHNPIRLCQLKKEGLLWSVAMMTIPWLKLSYYFRLLKILQNGYPQCLLNCWTTTLSWGLILWTFRDLPARVHFCPSFPVCFVFFGVVRAVSSVLPRSLRCALVLGGGTRQIVSQFRPEHWRSHLPPLCNRGWQRQQASHNHKALFVFRDRVCFHFISPVSPYRSLKRKKPRYCLDELWKCSRILVLDYLFWKKSDSLSISAL